MKAAKRKKSIFLRIALVTFSVYVVVMLVQLQLEINNRGKTIDEANALADKLTTEIDDLKKQSDDYEQYLERKAREQGLARPGESIYKEIPGN